MNNIREMLPHSKSEVKVEPKEWSKEVDEICETRNCNLCLFFENKKRRDLYCWASDVTNGPSVKFLVENVHTMEKLKMTGNCLKGSRALLSFDPQFETTPHYHLMKEMLMQVFGTPNHHPKSQPFIDHVFTFTILDHRIWFRNFQIVEEDGSLAEIGPRFTLNPIKILEGSFCGAVLWTNEHYISPNDHRRNLKLKAQNKYKERVLAKHDREVRQPKAAYKDIDPHVEVFETIAPEEATGSMKNVFKRK